jgi:hypothetical protein
MSEKTDTSIEPDTNIESDQKKSSSVFRITTLIKIERINSEKCHRKSASSDSWNWRQKHQACSYEKCCPEPESPSIGFSMRDFYDSPDK